MLFDIKNLPEAADITTLYFHYYHHHLLFLKGKPGPTKSDDLFYFCQTGVDPPHPPPHPYFADLINMLITIIHNYIHIHINIQIPKYQLYSIS